MSNHRSDFLVFASPDIQNAEIDEVVACLKSGWIGTGPRTKAFEDQFARYKAVSSAVALNSCTAALFLSLKSLGIGPGDEVITTPLTFCATVNSIIHTGATPVLADIDPQTMNISPEEIEKKITKRTKCVLPVHFAGRPCEMDAISMIAREHKLFIVEDCAHAIESKYKGVEVGTFGDVGCFSFYVTKNIVTGEGGMVISKNQSTIDLIRTMSLHGINHDAWSRFSSAGYKHYEVVLPGYKFNMMDLQAAIGIHQLSRINEAWNKREKIWNTYNNRLVGLPIKLPEKIPSYIKHAYHLYTLQIDEKLSGITRDKFLEEMKLRNIGTGVHYVSLPEFEFYQKTFNWNPDDYPNAYRVGRQIVSLPLSSKLSFDDVNSVIDSISDIFGKV
jgi:dTDP-4-amino-4,6-dideoxygalactose transaminase